jgi:predicted DNA-binding protein (UPF0251 family)
MSEKDTKLTKPKRGRRVIDFSEEELQKLKHYSGLGLNQAELASVMGISESTLRRRKKDSALFERYIREGRTKAVSDVANALYVNATQENNIQAQIFFLKNRADSGTWVDRQETVNASINLNDVISGAKTRIGESMTNRIIDAEVNPIDTTKKQVAHQVNHLKAANKSKG